MYPCSSVTPKYVDMEYTAVNVEGSFPHYITSQKVLCLDLHLHNLRRHSRNHSGGILGNSEHHIGACAECVPKRSVLLYRDLAKATLQRKKDGCNFTTVVTIYSDLAVRTCS